MMILDGVLLPVLALVYAMIEIEIEGPNGWAKHLPTPQNMLAHLSLYHVFMVLLAAVVVGGFLTTGSRAGGRRIANAGGWGVGLAGEYLFLLALSLARSSGSPSTPTTPSRDTARRIGWHKPWLFGLLAFNYAGAVLLAVVLAAHPRARLRLGVTLLTGRCGAGGGSVASLSQVLRDLSSPPRRQLRSQPLRRSRVVQGGVQECVNAG